MSSSDSNQNESKKLRLSKNENKKQEEGSPSVVNHDLYNNQHYNLALARRNLNARLKPSVFPSRNSPVTGVPQHANGSHTKDTNKDHHSEMDALTRRRLLNQLPPRSNSSIATGGPIEQQHHIDREKSSESTTPSSSSIPSDTELIKSFMRKVKALENELMIQRQNVANRDLEISELRNQMKRYKELNESQTKTMTEMLEYMNMMDLPHQWNQSDHRPQPKQHSYVQERKSSSRSSRVQQSVEAERRSTHNVVPSRVEPPTVSNAVVQQPNARLKPQVIATKEIESQVHESDLDKNDNDSNSSSGSKDNANQERPTRPKSSSSDAPPRLNMEVVKRKFSELNSLLPEDEGSIVYSGAGNVKKMTKKPKSYVTFFGNGIVVDDGPFRPYEWDITRAFLNDIADGYFPYEFKEKHPDGVTLVPVDKTTEQYTKSTEMDHKLSEYKHTNIRDIGYLKTLSEYEGVGGQKKLSSEQFLSQLPKSVIRHGKIIPVRSDIEQIVKNIPVAKDASDKPGERSNAAGIDGATSQQKPKESSVIPTDCGKYCDLHPDRKKTVLKVSIPQQSPHNGDGDHRTLTMSMWIDETIGDAKRYIRPFIHPHSTTTPFQLRTAFPSVVLSDDTATLEEAKLQYAKLVVMLPNLNSNSNSTR